MQSHQWTQEVTTVYPMVVLRTFSEDICEDYLVFIFKSSEHDVPFAKHRNEILHKSRTLIF